MKSLGFTALILAMLPAVSLADTLIVANKYEGTVSFIDLDSGAELARRATGPSPHELALSPDQTLAVVVSYLEDGYIGRELNVFDVASTELIRTIDIEPHLAPHGIAWIGDSNSVIVTTEETRDVIRVDVERGKVEGAAVTDQIGSHLLALSPDASRAYVTSRGSDTVSVIDTTAMKTLETIEANKGPEAVFVSPDGKEVWVGNNQSENIIIFDAQSMDRIETIEMGFVPIRVRFNPAGDRVAIADLHGNRVLVYDAADRSELAVVDLNEFDIKRPPSLLFSPDGAHLYVGSELSEKVVEIATDNWKVTRLLEAGAGADGLEISSVKAKPDGAN
ncbi:YncE family protein [Ruegeria sp. 2205SS24-7]|uniref:YncE family protein n=1 Tax=Ruegeria discodermiae TaxID=3064389 RepID=UPI002740A544|nr:YncE family protein [Ruegeria sp. 2205SS24-7]MDP5216220.1 YncE family protein [Ruegeria sp. 2205SS24-7]